MPNDLHRSGMVKSIQGLSRGTGKSRVCLQYPAQENNAVLVGHTRYRLYDLG